MDLKEVGHQCVGWLQLPQVRHVTGSYEQGTEHSSAIEERN
jgi:hypothetical protein